MSIESQSDPFVRHLRPPFAEPRQPATPHLMGEVAKGNIQAFESLYDEFAPVVFGIIRHVLQDPRKSETVSRRTFVEIWRTASSFDPQDRSLRSWICAIAHRQAVEEARRDGPPRAPAGSPPPIVTLTHGGSAPAVIDTGRARADHALGQLTDVDRRSIELAYYGGLTRTTIALALGVEPEAVSRGVRAGLTQMRAALGANSTS